MKPLYAITDEIDALISEAIDLETGEIKSDALAAELEALEGKREEKACDIACVIVDMESEADRVRERAKELKARSDSLLRRAEWLRKYLTENLEVGTKLRDSRVSLSILPGKDRVVCPNPEKLPPQFQRVTIEAKKMELADLLVSAPEWKEAGIAWFEQGPPTVRIK